jgi:HEAT repeat protein
MRALIVSCVLLSGLQGDLESLVRRLTSGRIDQREAAAIELVRLGREAVPILEKAATDADPELAGRARLCLEKILFAERLTPGLRTVDGLSERLRRNGPGEWLVVLQEAVPDRGRPAYEGLSKADLACLATEVLRTSAKEESTIAAIQIIGEYRLGSFQEFLEKSSVGAKPQVRAAAAATLIRLAGSRGLEVAEPFLSDGEAQVRNAAIGAISRARLPGAGARLAEMTSDAAVGESLEGAFWELRAPEGIPFLEKFCRLEHWDDHPARSRAAMCLSFYAGPRQLPLFRGLLKWLPDDPNTGDTALRFLGEWGDRESLPRIEQIIETVKLWGNGQSYAPQLLFRIGATSSVKSFLTLARKYHSGTALGDLGAMGNRDAIPGLREFLREPEPEALLALAELDDRESIPAIRKALVHEDRRVREYAAKALAIFRDEPSLAAIAMLGKEGDAARVIWPALGPLKNPPAPLTDEILARRLKDPNYSSERLTTATQLLRFGRREGLPYLLERGYHPFALNALRRPALWKELLAKHAPLRLYAPYEKLYERLAEGSGLKLDGPPEGCDEHKAWTDVYQRINRWGPPLTIVEAFEMIEDHRWSVVLEDDRIRILPYEEARRFWLEWVEREGKK